MRDSTLPHPASPEAPKYWAYETGGELQPAMKRYLEGKTLTVRQISLLRAYLRQWINSPVWEQATDREEYRFALGALRHRTESIITAQDVDLCIEAMIELGMDPL